VTAPAVHRPTLRVQQKAHHLFTAGRARVDQTGDGWVAGTVQGSKPWPYSVGWWAEAWHCDCQARTFCAHILAMQLRLAADVMCDTGRTEAEVLAVPDPRWAELATAGGVTR
jgi:uncharacterized Zn finger protein